MYELATQDGYDLVQFTKDFKAVGKMMCQLCIRAYQLAEADHKIFKEYVIRELGLSRQTAERMITVGMIYIDHPGLNELPYTKAAELLPIREQLGDFREHQELKDDDICHMSQRELRDSVKCYLGALSSPEEIEEPKLTSTQKYLMDSAEYLHNNLRPGKVISKADRELIMELSQKLLKLSERRIG